MISFSSSRSWFASKSTLGKIRHIAGASAANGASSKLSAKDFRGQTVDQIASPKDSEVRSDQIFVHASPKDSSEVLIPNMRPPPSNLGDFKRQSKGTVLLPARLSSNFQSVISKRSGERYTKNSPFFLTPCPSRVRSEQCLEVCCQNVFQASLEIA